MNFNRVILALFSYIFIVWIGISIVRTFYNLSKLVTEERHWYFLSDEQKRAKQFGDTHYFLRFVESNVHKGSTIVFLTDDTRAFFLSRYYLYPTKRSGPVDYFLWNDKNIAYDYYVVYPANHKELLNEVALKPQLKYFKKIATYKGTDGKTGVIYKK